MKVAVYYFEASYQFNSKQVEGNDVDAIIKQVADTLNNVYEYRSTAKDLWAKITTPETVIHLSRVSDDRFIVNNFKTGERYPVNPYA